MRKRESILRVAKRLFAKKGYEATTMDEIANKASVNKALIYYYFKSKQSLYSYVIYESISSIKDYLDKNLDQSEPIEALHSYISAFYDQAKKDETFVRILMREIASSGEHLNDYVMEKFLDVLGILKKIIRNGVKKEYFNEKDTKIVHFIVVGAISFYLNSVSLRSRLIKSFPDKTELLRDVDDVPDELFEIILKGLSKDD